MRHKIFWIGIGILIAVFGGIILTSVNSSKIKPESSTSPSPTSIKKGEETVREITIQANEYSFFPSFISVKKGEKVQLTLKNMGAMPHNLIIDELNLATKTIGSKGSDVIEFVPEEEGEYLFYCNLGNHRDLGMEGTLEIK